jgi:hypothetical protein
MMGIAVWVQQEMLTSIGNFLVVYGIVIMISMYLIQKRAFTKSAKWWVPISAVLLLVVLEITKFILTKISTS